MLVLIAVALMPLCLILCHSLWLEPHHPTDEEDNSVRIRIGSGEPLESSEPVSSDASFATRLLMDTGGVHEVEFNSVIQDGYRVFDLPLAASRGADVCRHHTCPYDHNGTGGLSSTTCKWKALHDRTTRRRQAPSPKNTANMPRR